MADVTGEEFRTFMTILSSLKVMASAHQELADIVAEQAELNQVFQVQLKGNRLKYPTLALKKMNKHLTFESCK